VGGQPLRRQTLLDVVREKQLPRVAPHLVHGALQPVVTLLRAAAELQHPLTAVSYVIAALLEHLRGDSGETLVRAPLQRFRLEHREDAEEELTGDGEGEVPLGELD